MTHIHTAIGEVLRTGIDALRGLGYSFALADRGTHMLTFAEAVHGTGLRYLHDHEADLRAAMARPLRWTDGVSPAIRTGGQLDACGRCVLEAGPRALDLADAGARTDGAGVVLMRNALGTDFLAELAAHSAARGLGTLILFQPQSAQAVGAGGAQLGLPSSAGGEEVLAIHGRPGLSTRPGAEFGPLIALLAGADRAAAVREFLDAQDDGDDPANAADLSRIVFVSFDPAAAAGEGRSSHELVRLFTAAAAESGIVDLGARWRHAVAQGFEIAAQDWAYLYSLVGRTRVVTSERSRQQAG